MSFFEFIGGFLVFGFCWLFAPRLSFAVALSIVLIGKGVNLFPMEGYMYPDLIWESIATGVIVILGCLGGLVLDIIEHANTFFERALTRK